MKHVAVLMGGWSAEREVSLRSGKACADALETHRATRSPRRRHAATSPRNSNAQARRRAQRAARPPRRGRHAARHAGNPRHPVHAFRRARLRARDAEGPRQDRVQGRRRAGAGRHGGLAHRGRQGHVLEPPYVIKPNAEGSSVGVFIVTEDHEHPPQELTRADWAFGELVLVEPFIAGKELTCAVMGDEALGVIEIVPTARFYDYEAKYAPGGSTPLPAGADFARCLPGGPPTSACAHRALGCRGVSRADFRWDDSCEGIGGSGLSRSQHPARHDRNLAGARAGGARGHPFR